MEGYLSGFGASDLCSLQAKAVWGGPLSFAGWLIELLQTDCGSSPKDLRPVYCRRRPLLAGKALARGAQ